jgi:hypothetical protein
MTDELIAPVIPSAVGRVRSGPGRAGGGRPLPLADPLAVPLDAIYGMSRIDASGRPASHAISHVLNWQPGDRLTLTGGSGVVVAHRDPHGTVTVPARYSVAIPAALRHRLRAPARRPGAASHRARSGHPDRLHVRCGGPGAPGARSVAAR